MTTDASHVSVDGNKRVHGTEELPIAENGSVQASPRLLTTLGMFILDEFRFDDAARKIMSPPAHVDGFALGGGGTYAVIGARIWTQASELGMIVDRGGDWPADAQKQLDSYGSEMFLYRDDKSRGTTRSLNTYTGELRGFEYLTTNRPQLNPRSLIGTPFYGSRWLHIICAPTRMLEIIEQLDGFSDWQPRLCYEPLPQSCVPDELPTLRKVLPQIDVFSPNHEEAASFLGGGPIEDLARRFVEEGAKDIVVIRSGARGACCTRRVWSECHWVPAYHKSDAVVDVTGAGNSFLGGFVVGFERTGDVLTAARYGSISSAFTIEQWGLPSIRDGLCNGVDPTQRLAELEP